MLLEAWHLLGVAIEFWVALEVPKVTVSMHFNERWAISATRATHRLTRSLVNGDDVILVHGDARDAVALGAIGIPREGGRPHLGHRDRIAIVLTDEDNG